MEGLIILAIVIGWLTLTICAARWVARKLPVKLSLQRVFATLLAIVAFVLPVADELVARPTFSALCDKAAMLTIDAEKIKGRTVTVSVNAANEPVPGLPIQVLRSKFIYKDSMTGEVLGTYETFRGRGGLLARTVRTEGTHPITGSFYCAPEEGSAVSERYGFVLLH